MTTRSIAHARRPLGLAIALAFAAVNAHAITISVNDGGDAASPTGCTLRDAITAVDTGAFALPGPDPCSATSSGAFGSSDTISFDVALASSTITLLQGQLAISAPLTITGSGQTIDANAANRALYVTATTSASNLTFTNGSIDGNGSAIFVGGASNTLTLTNTGVSGNAVTGTGNGGGSIGVKTGATLALVDASVTGNTSTRQTAGIYVQASGATITNSTISGNSVACSGNYCAGAVYASASVVLVNGSTLASNSVTAGATSTNFTGAVYSWDGVTSIVNSTIAGNYAYGTDFIAGAVQENHTTTSTGFGLTLTNTTVSGNIAKAFTGTAQFVTGGALIGAYDTGAMTLGNSIISGNSAINGAAPAPDFATNSANNPTLNFSYSLLGNVLNVSPYSDVANHNVFSDTPGLGPLQDNGGPTQTMALLPSSVAIDAGSNSLAVDAGAQPLLTDQEGFVRIFNYAVDIGAFEFPGDRIFRDGFE
jgi:hypothetical protein